MNVKIWLFVEHQSFILTEHSKLERTRLDAHRTDTAGRIEAPLRSIQTVAVSPGSIGKSVRDWPASGW
jgi:hypothetical protein